MDDEYLDISVYWEFIGAYPTGNEVSLLFSLLDGRSLGAKDLFQLESYEDLVILCDEKLQQNIIQKMTDDPELHGYTTREEHHFQEENLVTVGIRSNGIQFFYNFDYPHALLAAEPSGDIFFEWNEIQDFLLPGVKRNWSVEE